MRKVSLFFYGIAEPSRPTLNLSLMRFNTAHGEKIMQMKKLAAALTPERLLAFYDFTGELVGRISRNAASAAVTCALTSDVYRICFQ